MAHKTLIGGTAYDLAGGMTLVGGTAYEIAGGKTLVEGTAYDIPFSSTGAIPVYIDGSTYNEDEGRYNDGVMIHGVEYNEGSNTFEPVVYVNEGDTISAVSDMFVNDSFYGGWASYTVPGDITEIHITLTFDAIYISTR